MNSPAPFAIPSPLNVVARQWRDYYLAVSEQLGEALESLENANAALTIPQPPNAPASANIVAVGWQAQYTTALTQIVTLQAQIAQLQTLYVDAQRLAVRTKSLHIRGVSAPGPSSGYPGSFFKDLISTTAGSGPVQLVPPSQALGSVSWLAGAYPNTASGASGFYMQTLTIQFACDVTYPPTEADPWFFDVQFVFRDSQYNQNNVGYGLYPDTDARSQWFLSYGTELVPEVGIQPDLPDWDSNEGPTVFYRACRVKVTVPNVLISMNFQMTILPAALGQYGSVASTAPEQQSVWDFRVSTAPPN